MGDKVGLESTAVGICDADHVIKPLHGPHRKHRSQGYSKATRSLEPVTEC
jgi:hypothetical protein